jgi:hypothetical protein
LATLVHRSISGFIPTLPGKTGKPGKVKEPENRPKSHGKVKEIRENLKKTWKSHGICHLVKN